MKLPFAKQLLALFLALFMTQPSVHAEYLENAVPPAKAFDWMELQSGEWLKGEFKEFYSGSVKFDSDEMDLLSFDIEDVKQIITKGNASISIEQPITFSTTLPFKVETGKLHFHDKKFYLTKEDGTALEVEIEDVASIIGGEEKESNYWTASAFLGLDVLTGNTEQVTLTAKANVQRRTAITRFIADYLGVYTEVDGNRTTADSNRVTGSFDIYQTAHFFWRAASGEYLRDPFQNIAHRYTVAVGAGYDIIYTPKTDWTVTVGPGYQHTTFDTVEINASETADTALVYLDSRFDTELSKNVDFIFNYNMYLLDEDSGTYTHHAMVSLETEFISDLDFDLSLIWDRTQDPVPFSDGTAPLQDDYKTMIGLGYSY